MLLSFYFALLAHPAFIGPIDELNAIVLRLSTIHKKCFFSLSSHQISILFGLFERAPALRQRWVNISCGSAVRHCVFALVIFSCSLVFDDCRTIVKYKDYVAVFIGVC